MNSWLELLIFNVFFWVVVAIWQFLSEWWERRGGGKAFSRRGILYIGLVTILFLNVILVPLILLSEVNA
jgi:hypothetical protein